MNEEEIEKMLSLYATGDYSSVEIGRMHGIDHSTVLYHAKKHGIIPPRREILKNLALPVKVKWIPKKREPVVDKYAHVFDVPVRNGRSYDSYLKEAMQRPIEKAYMEMYRMV